ncbi:MAG: pilus assembly protein PilM [Proteobacteria bacterium]|nr:pilus assembly protein PilM [Pseudomonadota bacterium]
MGERSLGIEVLPSRVKIVEVDSSTFPPRVFHFSSVNLFFPDLENTSQQMLAALSYMSLRAKKARIALDPSSNPCVHSLFSLPPMPGKEMRVVVERELKETLERFPEEMVFDFQIMGEEEEGKKAVLAAAAPSALVREQALFIQNLRLTPALITTAPFALFQGLKLVEGVEEGTVALIHLGASKVHVLVLKGGRWAFHREFSRKPTPGEETFSEIYRTFLFYRKSQREEIGRVFLTGNGSEGLEKDLKEAVGVKIEQFYPTLDLSPLRGKAKEFRQILPEFVIPLGLAGRREKESINLLRPLSAPGKREAILKKAALAAVVVSVLTLGAAYAWLDTAISKANQDIPKKREEIKRYEPYVAAQKERELYREHSALVRDFGNHGLWAELLRELSLLAPPEMAFQFLGVKREGEKIKVNLKGEVFSPQASISQEVFNRFYSRLTSSPLLAQLEIDPGSMKVGQQRGGEKEGPVQLEFEVKGELKPLKVEYENF